MNPPIHPEHITIPASWSAEQDLEHHEQRFGESDNYFGEVERRIVGNLDNLAKVLNRGCQFFERKRPCRPIEAHAPESLDICVRLLHYVRQVASSEEYLGRFEMHIELCRWVLTEYATVWCAYSAIGEGMWLYPLSELADWIACAAFDLDEALGCEHEDYRM
jgi:hypothetical protein